MAEKIIFIMQEAISAVFPLKKVSNKQAKKILNPWMSKEILKVQKERDLLKKKWIGLGHVENSPVHIKFKKCRNKVLGMIRAAKKQKLQKKCEEAKGDSKKLWKVAKNAMNIQPKPNVFPDFVKIPAADGKCEKVENKTEIANTMNRQFAEMGAKLAEKLDSTDAHFSDYLQRPNPNHERLVIHVITECFFSSLGNLLWV